MNNPGTTTMDMAPKLSRSYATACAIVRSMRHQGLMAPYVRPASTGTHGRRPQALRLTEKGMALATAQAAPDAAPAKKSRVGYEQRTTFFLGVILATLDQLREATKSTLIHKGGVPTNAIGGYLRMLEDRGDIAMTQRGTSKFYRRLTK